MRIKKNPLVTELEVTRLHFKRGIEASLVAMSKLESLIASLLDDQTEVITEAEEAMLEHDAMRSEALGEAGLTYE